MLSSKNGDFFFKESRRHVARHRNVSKWRTTCLKQRVNRRSWPFGFDAPSPCQSPVSWAWRSEYLSRNRKLGSSALRLFLWTGLRCGTSSLKLSALMFGPFGCQKLISFAKLIWFRHGRGFRIIRTYIMTKAYWVHYIYLLNFLSYFSDRFLLNIFQFNFGNDYHC